MLQIGLNSQVFSSKNALNAEIGGKAAAVLRALREFNQLAQAIAAFTDAELKTLGFGDGTNGTDNELGYGVRDPAAVAADLFKILNGQAPVMQQPTDYAAKLRYVSGSQG